MKTLDEVIKVFEQRCCQGCDKCPYYPDDCLSYLDEPLSDALHYLKEYRSDMQIYSENQKYWEDELKQKIKDFGDAKERYIKRLKELDIGTLNDPLSWEQLKQMEGKPVWIQEGDHGYWIIIESFTTTNYGYHWLNSAEGCFEKEYMGISWQAYRKEKNICQSN